METEYLREDERDIAPRMRRFFNSNAGLTETAVKDIELLQSRLIEDRKKLAAAVVNAINTNVGKRGP